MDFTKVADVADLSDGQLLSVALGNEPVCLAQVAGQVFALRDRCSHADFPLSEGSLSDDHQLECCLHGAVFDVRSGDALEMPAEEPVPTYEVKVQEGGIWIRPAVVADQ